MENDPDVPSNIENLKVSFDTFNSVIYTDVREATYEFSDYMNTLGRILAVPGTVAVSGQITSALLGGPQKLAGLLKFEFGRKALESARNSIDRIAEEARDINSVLIGRREIAPT
jgi:hypothetical protein